MQKTGIELAKERMKARAFIREYQAEHGELPTAQQVKAARALTEEEIAEVVAAEGRSALIAESEDKEPSAIAFGAPKVGINMPSIGEITAMTGAISYPEFQ